MSEYLAAILTPKATTLHPSNASFSRSRFLTISIVSGLLRSSKEQALKKC